MIGIDRPRNRTPGLEAYVAFFGLACLNMCPVFMEGYLPSFPRLGTEIRPDASFTVEHYV